MDGKWVLQQVQKRLNGQMPDKEWNELQEFLDNAARISDRVKCHTCDDTGTVTRTQSNGGRYLYLCQCEAGQRQNDTLYAPSDKQKERPVTLAKYREPRPYVRPFGEKDD